MDGGVAIAAAEQTHNRDNSQRFLEDELLRSQRFMEKEAKAATDLRQQEQVESGDLTTRPIVSDIAEGIGVSVEGVHRLLQQIRTRRAAEEQRLTKAFSARPLFALCLWYQTAFLRLSQKFDGNDTKRD